jgi:hypothetical protein
MASRDFQTLFLGLGSFSEEAFLVATDDKPSSWWMRKAQRRADRILEVVELRFPDGGIARVWPRWNSTPVKKRIDRLVKSISSDRSAVEVLLCDRP